MAEQDTTPVTRIHQVAIRPYIDIRCPAPGFVAALAEQFEHAERRANGALCVSVRCAAEGDDTREVVETLLYAAAAHRESDTSGWVQVAVTGVRYTSDGYCHVLAHCQTMASPARAEEADEAEKAERADANGRGEGGGSDSEAGDGVDGVPEIAEAPAAAVRAAAHADARSSPLSQMSQLSPA